MIFKTFQSDLDGISNKIGFSKRSFAEWGKQVSTSFKESEGAVNRFKNVLKTAFTVPLEKDNSWLKNNFGEIVDKENINSFIPKLDTDSARAELDVLQNIQNKINETKGSWDDYNNQFKDGRKYLLDYAKQNNVLEASVDDVKQANQTARDAVLAHNEAIKAQTLSAKAGKVALQTLATVGNMFAMWAISKGLELAVKGIDNLINKSEKAREKLKETLQKSYELTETYKQEQADLDSTIEKYKDLNEQLTNAYLTTEEYNGIKEQLIGLQDDLVSKYGEEASAIDIVNGKYDEQIRKLETLSRQKAQDFVNENLFNVYEAWDFLNKARTIKIKDQSFDTTFYETNPEKARKKISEELNFLRTNYGNTNNKITNDYIKHLSRLLNSEELSSENINQAKQILLNNAKASVDSNYEIQSVYDSYVEGIERYNNALETGEGIDEAYSNYEKLRGEFKNVSADILGIEYLYDDLSNKLNEPLDLSFKLDKNIEDGNETTKRYLNKLQGVTSDQLRSLDYDDLLSVNSLNNYEDALGHLVKQLDVSESGVDALIDKLIELGYVADSVEIQNKENILNAMGFDKNASSANAAKRNTIANNVYNSLTEKQKKSLGDNLELIPPESYNWTEQQWLHFIKNLQKDADENQLEIPTSLDTAEALKSATDAFSKLGDTENGLYADILAGNTIDSNDIFALKDDFGDIDGGRALENFADTLLQFPGDTKKAQEALNDLVTAYINESGILDDLNEGNKDYIKQELEEINVTNAEEVIEDRLNDSVKKNIKAFKEFSTVLSQHLDTLKNTDPETDKFKNSLETVKSSFEDFLKANFGDEEFELSLSDKFIIQNLEDIEAAASGSEEALNRVRREKHKQINNKRYNQSH